MDSKLTTATILMLTGIVIIAAVIDIKSKRIPNKLVLAGMILSIISQVLIEKNGIVEWASGFLTGFAIFFPFYFLRIMGAGDVKLVAVVGGFVGTVAATKVILFTLVAGGVLAIITAIYTGVLRKTLENVRFMVTHAAVKALQKESLKIDSLNIATSKMPYGLAIALGTLTYLTQGFWSQIL